MISEVSDDVAENIVVVITLGIVMNLEPSLFVYFEVAVIVFGRGGWADCKRGFAGIPMLTQRECERERERERVGTRAGDVCKECLVSERPYGCSSSIFFAKETIAS